MISSIPPSGSFDLLYFSLVSLVECLTDYLSRKDPHRTLYICKRPPMGFSESISYEKKKKSVDVAHPAG
jgi:hypothetical protein